MQLICGLYIIYLYEYYSFVEGDILSKRWDNLKLTKYIIITYIIKNIIILEGILPDKTSSHHAVVVNDIKKNHFGPLPLFDWKNHRSQQSRRKYAFWQETAQSRDHEIKNKVTKKPNQWNLAMKTCYYIEFGWLRKINKFGKGQRIIWGYSRLRQSLTW